MSEQIRVGVIGTGLAADILASAKFQEPSLRTSKLRSVAVIGTVPRKWRPNSRSPQSTPTIVR